MTEPSVVREASCGDFDDIRALVRDFVSSVEESLQFIRYTDNLLLKEAQPIVCKEHPCFAPLMFAEHTLQTLRATAWPRSKAAQLPKALCIYHPRMSRECAEISFDLVVRRLLSIGCVRPFIIPTDLL